METVVSGSINKFEKMPITRHKVLAKPTGLKAN